jgi:hypothetical protein
MKQWRQIVGIVEAQCGVIGKAQLDEVGVTSAHVRAIVRDRQL